MWLQAPICELWEIFYILGVCLFRYSSDCLLSPKWSVFTMKSLQWICTHASKGFVPCCSLYPAVLPTYLRTACRAHEFLPRSTAFFAPRFGPPPSSLHSLMASAQAASICSGRKQKEWWTHRLVRAFRRSTLAGSCQLCFMGRVCTASLGRYGAAESFPPMLSVWEFSQWLGGR